MGIYQFPVYKTARYATLGNLSSSTSHVWFVCHGYGQLAPYFIKHFTPLDDGKTYVVAPEALSRFYVKHLEGRVGATWMTKEERKQDIQDYVSYLDALYDHVFEQVSRQQVKVHLLGFSQGAATVSRWIAEGAVTLDSWILWGGLFPHDLNFTVNPDKLRHAPTFLVYGDQDPYWDDQKLRERHQIVADAGVQYEHVTFQGGHEIPENALAYFTNLYSHIFKD
jgi:predicted esterase